MRYVFLRRIHSSANFNDPLCWRVEVVRNGEVISTQWFGLNETEECRKWIQRFVPQKFGTIHWKRNDFYGREFEVDQETEAWEML